MAAEATSSAGSVPSRVIPRPDEVFDPVARGLDLIGDRWTLVLVRHLLGGPRGFQELRSRTGITPRVLSSRLRQLAAQGLVESVAQGSRSLYAVTARGRTLEPIISAVARWWVAHAMEEHVDSVGPFTETSAQSVLDSLPFLLREDRARGVDLAFEIRLEGPGGGVWTVRISAGSCRVERGFAEHADVRYTAQARTWCAVATGFLDAREAHRKGLLNKDGAAAALDHYFHQIPHPGPAADAPDQGASGSAEKPRRAT